MSVFLDDPTNIRVKLSTFQSLSPSPSCLILQPVLLLRCSILKQNTHYQVPTPSHQPPVQPCPWLPRSIDSSNSICSLSLTHTNTLQLFGEISFFAFSLLTPPQSLLSRAKPKPVEQAKASTKPSKRRTQLGQISAKAQIPIYFTTPPDRFAGARSIPRCRQPEIDAKDGAFLRLPQGFLVVSWLEVGGYLPSPANSAEVAQVVLGLDPCLAWLGAVLDKLLA
jgi:hypothetical protein